MERHGKRLGHRGGIVVACLRNQAANACRGGDEVGEAAIHLQTKRSVVRTKVRPAKQTPATLAARDPGSGDDAIPNRDSGHLASSLDHRANELVPEDHAWATENRAVIPLGRVGAADRGTKDLEHDLVVGRRCGIRDVFDLYVAWPVEDRGPHALNTRSEP